jgi:hypothetical protein
MKVQWCPARPSPGWPDEITALIRFSVTRTKRECPACGKSSKRAFWTMLVPFRPGIATAFKMELGDLRPALTAVCVEHPLQPDPALMPAIMCEQVEQGAANANKR